MDTKKLRQKILDLAIRGKLVPQDPNDEPASVLLERIRAEKERLIKEGKIKRGKKTASDDEIEAPFEIPESWEWCKLGNIMKLKSGECIRIRSLSDDSKYPVYGGNGINGSYNDYNVEAETLIIGRVGFYCGSIHKTYSKAWVTDNALIVTYNKSLFYVDYLKYALKYLNLSSTSNSTAQPVVSGKGIYPLLIPIPPLVEQQRIINEVERWFSVIDALESNEGDLLKAIDKAKSKILDLAIHGKLVPQDPNDEPAIELLKRINPKFEPSDNESETNKLPNSWCWTTIGSIFQHNTGKALNKSDSQEGTLKPYLTTSNVYWNRFDFTEVKEMYFKDSELEKCTIIKGDLLVCEGGDIGRAAIWNYDYDICIQNHLHKLRAKGQIDHRLYLYVLMLYKWTDKIHGKGIGLQGLSSGLLDKLIVPLPPYNEQIRIVAKIEEIFAVLDSIKESLEV
jgi:type I restriction enzyme S subunit